MKEYQYLDRKVLVWQPWRSPQPVEGTIHTIWRIDDALYYFGVRFNRHSGGVTLTSEFENPRWEFA